MTTVRTLRANEPMPEGFATGYENMPFMPDWVWVAESDGEALGVLMAAPCHGLIYLMRLCIKDDAQRMTAFALLRACMRETNRRGFKGFFMHIDPTKEIDRRFIPTVKKTGGVQLMIPQVMLVGSIERAARF